MKLEDFQAGSYKQQYQYQSYLPELINHPWIWEDPKINTLLEQATQSLGELNAFSLIVPDVDLFIQIHIIKEANASSRIEGTQTQMDEALMDKRFIDPERRDDWEEVQNYVQAMNYAIEALEKLPLSNRLLKDTHAILLQGVRGEKKSPGDFRTSQNWIGGTKLQDAVFIPPHQDDLSELMSDLESFWHNEDIEVPHLIRIAISHYQFETIHPFLDGNGRIGRLLITLYLVSKGLLYKPSLYLSYHLEKHRDAYFDALRHTRTANDLLHWIRFFLVAVIETAQQGKQTFQAILELRNEVEQQILKLGQKAPNARRLLNFLYRKPLATANEVAEALKVSPPTARTLLQEFEELGILTESTGFQRNRVYGFNQYQRLFEN